jgi:hypothetical protein
MLTYDGVDFRLFSMEMRGRVAQVHVLIDYE